jgi:MerR family transcriptional regulator, light-induced transcriptional regulator
VGGDPGFEEALAQAIHGHDRAGAVSLALRALSDRSVSLEGLHATLTQILVDIGSGWQSGTTEVWQEHLVTGIVRTIVEASALEVDALAPEHRHATVVLAAPGDEYHDLGLRMLADRFSLAGWRSHFLGAALPVEEAVAAVRELHADAVALSASTHFHRLSLKPYVAHLVAAHPNLRVWVGGPAFAHQHAGWPDEMVVDPESIPPPGET